MPACSLDFRSSCGQFVSVFINFMMKRAKRKTEMRAKTMSLRTGIDSVLFGCVLSFIYMGPLLLLCGDVELNPGPGNLRQSRLTSNTRSASASPSPPSASSSPGETDIPDHPTLKDLMATVVGQNKTLNDKIDSLQKDVSDMKDSYDTLKIEMTEIKEETKHIARENEQLVKENHRLLTKVESLEEKVDDLECRSKRNNIIVHGIPRTDDETGQKCEKLLQGMLKDKLNLKEEIPFDRVHRLGPKRNAPIIACCTFYKDKKNIMKVKKSLKGSDVFVREDFSSRVRDIRKRLSTHLRAAKNEGKQAFMVYDHLIIQGKKFIITAENKLEKVE